MNSKILLAGIGGQGVLFAHQALAACAIAQGFDVTGAETHGMSQRGGSVVSHLKIGDTSAPLIRQGTADFLLAFDATEAYRALPFVRRGGAVIVNSNLPNYPDERVRAQLATMGVAMRAINADAIARGLGRASAANVALIGFAVTCDGFPFTRDAMRETIARSAPERFLEVNLKAFDEGVQCGIRK
jgi:indolepyruvate ferredoxin oxidoreductase beta subunit